MFNNNYARWRDLNRLFLPEFVAFISEQNVIYKLIPYALRIYIQHSFKTEQQYYNKGQNGFCLVPFCFGNITKPCGEVFLFEFELEWFVLTLVLFRYIEFNVKFVENRYKTN